VVNIVTVRLITPPSWFLIYIIRAENQEILCPYLGSNSIQYSTSIILCQEFGIYENFFCAFVEELRF